MTRPVHNPGQWPALMGAATAAAYVDESSVERFLGRVGRVYPPPIVISGRGRVWRRSDIDAAIARLGWQPGSAAVVPEDVEALL